MIHEQHAKRLLAVVDEMRPQIVDFARSLIRFDSVNTPPTGNEGPCQAFVAARLRQLGLEVDTFTPDEVPGLAKHPAYLHGRSYAGRPNVVGEWAGAGNGRSLMLVAHADVVSIGDPASWTVEPFGAQVIGGKIYGRGAVDDRDGLTGMLAAVEAIQAAGLRPRGRLILSSCVDEEFAGTNGLLAVVLAGYRADAAINCDGIGFLIWLANTGGGPLRVLIQSRVDTSFPTPNMRRLQSSCKQALTDLSARWRDRYWNHPLYPPGTPNIKRKEPIEVSNWEEAIPGWQPLTSGPACGVWAYATTLPGQDRAEARAEIVAALEAAYAACNCSELYPPRVEWIYRFMDACEVPADASIVQTVGDAYSFVSGRPAQIGGGLRSDLFVLPLYGGMPAVSFGVGDVLQGRGSAHEVDECIDIDGELIPYVKMLALAILDWCGYGLAPGR